MSDLDNVLHFKGEKSRTISAENKTGEAGKAAMSTGKLGPSRKGSADISMEAGQTITLADINGPGEIRHMWFTVTNKTTKGSFVLRDLVLRIYWDEEETPSVEAPLGDFFCNGFGARYQVNSLPIVVNPVGGMNCYFKMPFNKHAKITISNEHPAFIKHFFYTINYVEKEEKDNDLLYFHAYWNRENPVQLGEDYTLVDNIEGHGYYVGTFMSLCSLERYWWGEGEFKFFIDKDEDYPTVTSTGAEDYFGGAWAFQEQPYGELPHTITYSTMYQGYPYHSNQDHTRDRFSAGKSDPNSVHACGNDGLPSHALYRWHLPDPIAFSKGLKVTFQDIGNDDIGLYERSDDVSTVAYWYQSEPHNPFRPLLDRKYRIPR
ncbi:MAG: DUF2961 domain-containing protein [Ligilactobacillus agilis]|uniref:glycoside hydrolase family 172 protein n=1 Tax=Ligilactobacillus agilis TaxID=1601 RepID=UPI00242B4DAB|nr:glycoside hydrolase family 172 protein [Ligilactobacillus agilis]MCI5762699.1 DUF2961 domain-containing protein [Ligilactobacillus agilis]MDY4064688.1 glycoside hydrolase family 172 protein [Ligilactobacillus agilis]